MPLGELGVNSAILAPADGAEVAAGPVEVRGYAITGGDSRVARVDVSADGGATWQTAELDRTRAGGRGGCGAPHPGAARPVGAGGPRRGHRRQHPAREVGALWNFQGYANNAWPRTRITAR